MSTRDLSPPLEWPETVQDRRLDRMVALGLIGEQALWSGRDPRETLQAFGIRPPEFCRRPCWTMGPAVRLGDGRRWHLPRLDLGLALTTPGLLAAVRAFVRAEAAPRTGPDDDAARERFAFAINDVVAILIGSNYDLSWRFTFGGREQAEAERAEQHADNLARVMLWPDPDLWANCGRALIAALDRVPGLVALAVALDPRLDLGDPAV